MNEREFPAQDFFWRGLTIRQDSRTHKIGTDAILLASWVPAIISSAHQILDAGTGTGVISLGLARDYPEAKLCAVDVDLNAIGLAQWNVTSAGLTHRITVAEEDILNHSNDLKGFDLVVSNPPYYTTHQPSVNAQKRLAKHASGPVSHWMHALLQRMVPAGHCCVIIPSADTEKWVLAANEEGAYCAHRLDVYSFARDDMPVRSLLHFTRTLRRPEFSRLVLYREKQKYTPQYLSFSGIQTSH